MVYLLKINHPNFQSPRHIYHLGKIIKKIIENYQPNKINI
jgi:hypothetical protein